jgi:hypothetical protein
VVVTQHACSNIHLPLSNVRFTAKALSREVCRIVDVIVDEDDGANAQPCQSQGYILADATSSQHKADLPLDKALIKTRNDALPVKDIARHLIRGWPLAIFDLTPSAILGRVFGPVFVLAHKAAKVCSCQVCAHLALVGVSGKDSTGIAGSATTVGI